MRHGKKFNHLGRTSTHRKAMLSNMAASLIINKRITTTVAKAKALRQYVEPLITKSKTDTTQSRRVVFSYLQDKVSSQVLFTEVAEKVADRPGGYTRIIKLGTRMGDNAEIALIELVDFNDLYTQGEETTKTKTRRSRRGGKKKSDSDAAATSSTENAAVDTAPVDTAATDAETTTEVETASATSDTSSEVSAEEETPVAEVEVTETEKGEVVELSGGAVVDEPVVIEETVAEEDTAEDASTLEEEPKASDETDSDTDDEEKDKA